MTRFAFAIPGDLDLPTGGYAYDRRVIDECRRRGHVVEHLPLPGDFPFPGAATLSACERAFKAVPADCPILVDGLALGALPAPLLNRAGRRFVALVHHPLALETGLPEVDRNRLFISERAALAEARGVIATSATTARTLIADYGVPAETLVVAEPGCDPASRATGSGIVPLILAVGAVVPRKGYPLLVEALAALRHLSWACTIIGATDRDPAEVRLVRQAIEIYALSDSVAMAGQVDEHALESAYGKADIFVLPSYYEGYGMVLAEAMAHGLPIVSTTGGAIPDTVPEGAGILVTPGDARALASALERLVFDGATRQRLGDAAWLAGQRLPRWETTVIKIVQVVEAM